MGSPRRPGAVILPRGRRRSASSPNLLLGDPAVRYALRVPLAPPRVVKTGSWRQLFSERRHAGLQTGSTRRRPGPFPPPPNHRRCAQRIRGSFSCSPWRSSRRSCCSSTAPAPRSLLQRRLPVPRQAGGASFVPRSGRRVICVRLVSPVVARAALLDLHAPVRAPDHALSPRVLRALARRHGGLLRPRRTRDRPCSPPLSRSAAWPSLAAWGILLEWAPGVQDLWMLLFALLSVLAFSRGRTFAAVAALAMALLSKGDRGRRAVDRLHVLDRGRRRAAAPRGCVAPCRSRRSSSCGRRSIPPSSCT